MGMKVGREREFALVARGKAVTSSERSRAGDALHALYPPAAAGFRVVEGMPAPRQPNPPPNVRNTGTVHDFYGKALLFEAKVPGGDELAFIDKAFPHSRYDVMALVSSEPVRTSAIDLAAATKSLLGRLAYHFVEYLSDRSVIREYGLEDGHFHMCFNYDRHTVDRENSMFYDKRFHLHLNYWPGRDLALSRTVSWGRIASTAERRRLLDPATFLGTSLLHDATLGQVAGLRLMSVDDERDLRLGLPPGLKLELAGFTALCGPHFADVLDELHLAAERVYSDIYEAFTGHGFETRVWSRPRLLPTARIAANLRKLSWLSPRSLAYLSPLAAKLTNLEDDALALYRHDEAARVRRMSLAGLDYSIGLASRQRNTGATPLVTADKVLLVMQPRLFGDIGGAGLPWIDGIPIVKVDRSRGEVLSEAEVLDRRRLRERFLSKVTSGQYAGLQLRPLEIVR
jgi:hypothetical protein